MGMYTSKGFSIFGVTSTSEAPSSSKLLAASLGDLPHRGIDREMPQVRTPGDAHAGKGTVSALRVAGPGRGGPFEIRRGAPKRDGIPAIVPRGHREHQRGVGDGVRQGTVVEEEERVVGVRPRRHPAVARLGAVDAAEGGGLGDGAGGVRTGRPGHQAGGDRGRRAAAGSAGAAARIEGVDRVRSEAVLALPEHPERGRVGLAHDDRARRAKALHHDAVRLRDVLGVGGETESGPNPRGLVQILDRDGDTQERSAGVAGLQHGIGPGGVFHRTFRADGQERIELRIVSLDAIQTGAGRLHGGDLADADGGRDLGCAHDARPRHGSVPAAYARAGESARIPGASRVPGLDRPEAGTRRSAAGTVFRPIGSVALLAHPILVLLLALVDELGESIDILLRVPAESPLPTKSRTSVPMKDRRAWFSPTS